MNENKIVSYFINICLKGDLEEIARFLECSYFVRVIGDKRLWYYTIEALNIFYKKGGDDSKLVKKDSIYDNRVFKSDLNIFLIRKLIETADKNKIDKLIDFLLDDRVAGGIIRESISSFGEYDEEEKSLNNILWYASANKCKFNFERLVIKLLEKEDIVRNLPECLLKCLLFIFVNFNDSICPANIIKTILESKYIVDLIYKEPSFGKLFSKIPSYKYVDAFDIFFDDKIICEIGSDYIQGLFLDSTRSEKINILKKLLNTTAIEKLWKEDVLNCLGYCCKNNKTEVISLLINNDIILNKILKCPDKLIKCFNIACDNNSNDIIYLLLNKKEISDKIRKKINEDGIKRRIDNVLFMNCCNCQDTAMAEDFILNSSFILRRKNIDRLIRNNTPLLYNILNKKDFNEKDIKVAEILISKGLKINETNTIVRKNINKIVDYMKKEGHNIKKQYYGITSRQKLEKTKIAIEDIGKSLCNGNLSLVL